MADSSQLVCHKALPPSPCPLDVNAMIEPPASTGIHKEPDDGLLPPLDRVVELRAEVDGSTLHIRRNIGDVRDLGGLRDRPPGRAGCGGSSPPAVSGRRQPPAGLVLPGESERGLGSPPHARGASEPEIHCVVAALIDASPRCWMVLLGYAWLAASKGVTFGKATSKLCGTHKARGRPRPSVGGALPLAVLGGSRMALSSSG